VQGCQISPLFHEDGQDGQLINLSILPLGGWFGNRSGSVGPATNGTCWRTSRLSSGVRVLWLGVASGWCPVGWCFSSCQNCFIKRTHWAHPVWTRSFLLSAGAPSRAQEYCGQASSVTSVSHYGLLHRTSGRQALMLSRWWAADARVERMGARPNRAVVVKTALTCDSYSHSSTVLEPRPERKKIYLVTMSARF
jgi:hypothetical protein